MDQEKLSSVDEEFSLLELMSRVGQVIGVKLADELTSQADVLIQPYVGRHTGQSFHVQRLSS